MSWRHTRLSFFGGVSEQGLQQHTNPYNLRITFGWRPNTKKQVVRYLTEIKENCNWVNAGLYIGWTAVRRSVEWGERCSYALVVAYVRGRGGTLHSNTEYALPVSRGVVATPGAAFARETPHSQDSCDTSQAHFYISAVCLCKSTWKWRHVTTFKSYVLFGGRGRGCMSWLRFLRPLRRFFIIILHLSRISSCMQFFSHIIQWGLEARRQQSLFTFDKNIPFSSLSARPSRILCGV